jgi:trehalose 6-phosphate phosphatase
VALLECAGHGAVKYALARSNQHALRSFARSKVLIAFDYDGTLAPVIAQPERVAMRSSTRGLLQQLSALYPCVVITGRARADVMRRLRGVGVRQVVGNHGLEPFAASARLSRDVAAWRSELAHELSRFTGVKIEDKTFSLSVHYRNAGNKREARAAILRAARGLSRVRVVAGKQVVNLVPESAPHKGDALLREQKRLRCAHAIYVGDDDTDEDVFTLADSDLLSIRIGRSRRSAARYYLKSQTEIDALLRCLTGARR